MDGGFSRNRGPFPHIRTEIIILIYSVLAAFHIRFWSLNNLGLRAGVELSHTRREAHSAATFYWVAGLGVTDKCSDYAACCHHFISLEWEATTYSFDYEICAHKSPCVEFSL